MASVEIPQPYPGIRPFRESDWPVFFGREAQSNQLLHKLETTRFVAVVGSSGSGKSSLVRAGLIPLIRQGFLRNVTDWVILLCRPGVDPFYGLAYQISTFDTTRGDEEKPNGEGASVTTSLIAAELRASANGVVSVLEKFKLPPTRHVLLVVDQFEEMFGFRTSWTAENAASRGEAERFVDCVLRSCASDVTSPLTEGVPSLSERIWVLLTMRSDFIGHCEVFPALARCVSDSQFLVPVLNSEQKKEAIARPGETDHIDGATYAPFGFDEDVVSVVVNETGDRLDQLPLMQHALMRTWKVAKIRCEQAKAVVRITLDDYTKVGRIEEALHNDAEDAWREISRDPKLARITQQMFLLLCDLSEDGKLIRKRPKVSTVIKATGATLGELETILYTFQRDDRNFLRPIVQPLTSRRLQPGDALDVSHEALLRQWRTYKGWQVEERRRIDELIDLRRRAQLHAEGKEPLLGELTLNRLEEWKGEVNSMWASRYDINEQAWNSIQDFIEKSKAEIQEQIKEEQRRKRKQQRRFWTAVIGTAATLIAISATLLVISARSYNQNVQKERELREKEKAEADNQHALRLAATIGSSEKEPSGEEIASLWELARLDSGSEGIRQKLLEQWFAPTGSLSRALARNGQGLYAAIGVRPTRLALLRHNTVSLVRDLGDNKLRYLPDTEAWLALSASLDASSAREAGDALVRAMQNPNVDRGRLTSLGTILAGLLKTLSPDDAKILAGRGASILAQAMTQESDRSRLSSLGNSLAKFVSVPGVENAQDLAYTGTSAVATALEEIRLQDPRLASSTGGPQTSKTTKALEASTDAGPVLNLGTALVALIKNVRHERANALADKGAKPLIAAIHRGEGDSDPRLFKWAGCVAELNKLMEPVTREGHAKELIEFLFAAIEQQARNNEGAAKDRWSVIIELLSGLTNQERDAFGQRLMITIRTTPEALTKRNLSIGITQTASVFGNKAPEMARDAGQTIVDILEKLPKPQKNEPESKWQSRATNFDDDVGDLGTALAELAKVMRAEDRARLVKRGILALLERQMYQNWRSADALGELAKRVDEAMSKEDVQDLIERIVGAMERHSNRKIALWTLGDALVEIFPTAEPASVQSTRNRASDVLVRALDSLRNGEGNVLELFMFSFTMARLDLRAGPSEITPIYTRTANVLVDALRSRKGEVDAKDASTIVLILSELTKKMKTEDANETAERAFAIVIEAMDPQKIGTDAKRLANLGLVVRDLTKMTNKPQTAAAMANRASMILVKTEGTNAAERAEIGETLLALIDLFPAAKATRDFGLYQRMFTPIPPRGSEPDREAEDRQVVIRACARYQNKQQLIEILKWPLCTGEMQKIVLAEIEKRLRNEGRHDQFGGNVWIFVDHGSELGLSGLDAPPDFPSAQTAIAELERFPAVK
jgi:hypothetical protein